MGLFDFIARTGRGIGAAGRDVVGQMIGSTGPNDASTFTGRIGNIVANEANPLGGIAQTGNAFAEGFRGQQGTDPGRFAGTTEAISNAAASSRPGSVVARGFVGQRGLTRQPEQRNALGYRVGEAPTSERDPNWRMPGTEGTAPARSGARVGRSTAHVTGGDVSLSEHMARQSLLADRER